MGRRLAVTLVIYTITCCLIVHFIFKETSDDFQEEDNEIKDALGVRNIQHYRYPFIENGSAIFGRHLSIDLDFMKSKGFRDLPLTKFADEIDENNWDKLNFTFMTGSTANHFPESTDCVASIQKFFPGKPIVYYDWGLGPKQVKQVKKWCNVQYRKMDISDFEVVKQLNSTMPFAIYAMKVISVAHALQDFDGVFWLDASIRFLSSNIKPVFEKAKESGGLAFISRQFHSTYSVTDPTTYTFLPTNQEKLKLFNQVEAMYFIYKSEKIYKNIVWWLLLCGLEKQCLAPSLNLKCSFPNKQYLSEYVGCHRYDQSAINILAANLFNFNEYNYYVCMGRQGHKTLTIKRQATKMYKIKQC